MKIKAIKFLTLATVLGTGSLLTGCQPDDDNNGNGITPSSIDAGFTVEQVSPNRFTLTANTNAGVLRHFWDEGSGNGPGSATHDLFLPDAGTYTIGHTVCGLGVECYTETTTVNVETNDPVAGNIIVNGKFDDPSDISPWVVLPISSSGSSWTFANGEATLTGTEAWAQTTLYQSFQVEAGKTYRFDMKVSFPGMSNAFFEVYADYATPVAGAEYNQGKILQINTWAGCGTTANSGQLSSLSCGAPGATKIFPTSGTVYLVMRGGNEFGSFQMTIDNVEVRRLD